MANGTTTTTTPGMQRAESAMSNANATAKSGVSNVEGQLGALKSTWTGDASAAFDNSMASWIADCRYVSQMLEQMIQVMEGNRQTITVGEANNTTTATSIPTGPGMAL